MATTFDMTYDGQHVFWFGKGNFGKQSFNATSGMEGHQVASEQSKSNLGPIPEGEYYFSIKDAGTAHFTNFKDGTLDTDQGIESLEHIPGDDGHKYSMPQWGKNRVRLNLKTLYNPKTTSQRGGFYLHDSQKNFTHGCIEVDPAFFKKLREFASAENAKKNGQKTMSLKVKYSGANASTNGHTGDLKKVLDALLAG